jgi:hypothetical protein
MASRRPRSGDIVAMALQRFRVVGADGGVILDDRYAAAMRRLYPKHSAIFLPSFFLALPQVRLTARPFPSLNGSNRKGNSMINRIVRR